MDSYTDKDKEAADGRQVDPLAHAFASHDFMADQQPLSLTRLPTEIIHHILSFVSPYDLADVSATCRLLYTHTTSDKLWHSFVQENVPSALSSPYPAASFRDLYISHNPRWFLPRHKIWYTDLQAAGKLIFARYNIRRGCIEAYQILAERGPYKHGTLDWDGQIEYHTFNPKFSLDLNLPIVHLPLEPNGSRRFSSEVPMVYSDAGNRPSSSFLHTRALPQDYEISPGSTWPPLTLPSPGNQRTRNESLSAFNSVGHRPAKISDVSDATFRTRQWVQFTHFMAAQHFGFTRRAVDQFSTWATLPEECYTPTKEKPWQGIWCGDYSGHGCEFLLITQPDNPTPLSNKARKAFAMWPRSDVPLWGNDADSDSDEDEEADVGDTRSVENGVLTCRSATPEPSPDDVAPYKGRLEAIKLTGDPHIPRGEITFIAEDLGLHGTVGYADEPIFNENGMDGDSSAEGSISRIPSSVRMDPRGARMVKAVGHVANQGFRNEDYIPSRLIMVSQNRLAQYWMPYGHVDFYERVNLHQFLRTT